MTHPCTYREYTPLDGYAWIEQQANSIHGKLEAKPELGDWPYNCVVAGKRGNQWIIKNFCEHDVNTWLFNNVGDYLLTLEELKAFAGLEA